MSLYRASAVSQGHAAYAVAGILATFRNEAQDNLGISLLPLERDFFILVFGSVFLGLSIKSFSYYKRP
jgi:hypothetical protein